MSNVGFDPYHRWLGIPSSEQPPNHYRLLGLALFESDLEVIDSAAMRQMAHVRAHALGPQGDASQAILNQLADARRTLLDPNLKRNYDERLRMEDAAAPAAANTNEFSRFNKQQGNTVHPDSNGYAKSAYLKKTASRSPRKKRSSSSHRLSPFPWVE